jgi:hypothetical protein
LKASLVPLDPSEDPHSITKLEFVREKLDVVPDPPIDTTCWINEFEHEVCTARSRARTFLPRDGEYSVHEAVFFKVCDGNASVHSSSLSRMTDARLAAVFQSYPRYVFRSSGLIRALFATTDGAL